MHRETTGNGELVYRLCPCGHVKRNTRVRACAACLESHAFFATRITRAEHLFRPLYEALHRIDLD